jgi:xylulokinase
MGLPIVSLDVSETGCLGAAMLAAKSVGFNNSLTELAAKWVRPAATYKPNPANAEKYAKRFEIFSQIYKTLKPLGNMINSL